MKSAIKIAAAVIALAGGSALVGSPASAQVTVGVNVPGIAFGYNDGYWDRGHNWHAWKDHEEAERYRRENAEHYHEWKHDRDKDMGWREERYWEHH